MTPPLGLAVRPDLELHARYVLLSQWAAERRVLDIGGDAKSLLLLAESGVGELSSMSVEPEVLTAALAQAGVEGVEVAPLGVPPFPYADAAFDLIICHDLPEWLKQPEPWADELRRILDPAGYLVVAVPNPTGHSLSELCGMPLASSFTYEQVFKKLSQRFGQLTLFGQSPVVGHLFFDFESDVDEPGLAFDRTLLPDEGEAPAWYVLLFGPEKQRRDDLTIVQLPFATLAESLAGQALDVPQLFDAPPIDQEAVKAQAEALALAQQTLAARDAELAAVREALAAQQQALIDAREQAAKQEQELTDALNGRDQENQTLEQTLADVRAELANRELAYQATTEQVTQAHEENAQLHKTLAERDVALAAAATAAEEVQRLGDRLTETEAHLASVNLSMTAAEQKTDTLQAELQQVEQAYSTAQAERDQALARLQQADEEHAEQQAQERDVVSALEKDLAGAHEELRQVRSTLEAREQALAQAHAERTQTADELQARVHAAESRCQELQGERERVQRELNDALEQERTEAQAALEQTRLEAHAELEHQQNAAQAELLRERSERQAQQEEQAARTERLERELHLLRENLEKARVEAEETKASLADELRAVSEAHVALQARLAEREQAYTDAEAEIDRAHAETESMRQQLESTGHAVQDELATVAKNLELAMAERETLKANLAALEAGHEEKLRVQLAVLEATQAQEARLTADLEKLTVEGGRLREELVQMQSVVEQEQAQAAQALAAAREEHEKQLLQTQQALTEALQARTSEFETTAQALVSTQALLNEQGGRVQDLTDAAARQAKDQQSLEEQIRDLMEEASAAQKREASLQQSLEAAQATAAQTSGLQQLETQQAEALHLVTAERDAARAELQEVMAREEAKADALRQAQARAEQFLEELSSLKMRHADSVAERNALAAEVQRLTDAMHDRAAEPTPKPSEASAATKTLVPNTRDAMSRPLEQSLADIEDLIASSVPPSQNRR